MSQAHPLALLAALLLSLHGYRKGSLSSSGAVAAFFVGYLTLANPILAFGLTLLSFYLLGSRATKVGHEIKARLEREYDVAVKSDEGTSHDHGNKAKSGGQRDWVQVCCNGLGGALTSVAFRKLYSDQWQSGKAWCLLRNSRITTATFLGIPFPHRTSSTLPRSLFLMMLGHFACCMGDTLASETGILAKSPPRLILPPFRIVPPGTNGALSVQGTFGSLIGGALMGVVSGLSLLYLDNPACQHIAIEHPLLKIIALGALAGLGGSAIDSILGATLQRTWYHKKSHQVLVGRLRPEANTQEWEVITGRDVLSNNTVNLLSSSLTASLTVLLGSQVFE
ncbi:hypothetical protein CBS101457_004682 [Exobasidium rhododendri]|nr:hypothetical protein CBS101457_004682 [Exobasidium rhododendri]